MNRFTTPCFPQFRCKLAALGRRKAGRPQPSAPIDIEAQFKRFLPAGAPELPNDGKYRRNRKFPFAMVFWCFIWQVLKPRTSCREVVRQVQAFGETESLRYDESTSAYCQARLRLPESCLRKALADSAAAADRLSIRGVPGWSRPVKVVDGTGVSLPDTGANRAQYPYPSGQRPGCGFPNLKILGLYSLSSGAILQFAEAAKLTHDVRLFKNLWPELKPNDIAMGDRAFGAFFVMAGLPMRSVDVVARLHQRRLFDRRKARRIGPSDWIATWQRPAQRPTYIDEQEWNALPAQIEVRIIYVRVRQNGFRTRELWISTTLLDPIAHPAAQIAQLYFRRWDMELCFRDLKTTMGMEELRCRTPAMVRKELLAFLVAHNFIRGLIAEAAATHQVPRDRISFKGTVDAARGFHAAMRRVLSKHKNRQLRQRLLEIIARDRIPLRPGRCEPRAVKRRPKPYSRLTKPRHSYRETPHRGKRKIAA